jgi:hypothetical protein
MTFLWHPEYRENAILTFFLKIIKIEAHEKSDEQRCSSDFLFVFLDERFF